MEVLKASLSTAQNWIPIILISTILLPYLGDQMRQLSDQVKDLSLYDTET